jgi:hypothetical protein
VTILASWFIWPIVFFSLYWFVSILLATGRRCSIEGCDAPDGLWGVAWLAAMWGPPLYLTYRWVRARRAPEG